MARLSPEGPVYQAGTLSGNPLAVAAGLATLQIVASDATLYDRLERTTGQLVAGFEKVLRSHGVGHYCTYAGAMFCVFFTPDAVKDLEGARKTDRGLFAKYFGAMLDRGVYLAPSQFEANFLSAAHTARDVERTVAAADASLTALLASV
jgi:glutamate-1-semialdehyde 2,1-aminomutase